MHLREVTVVGRLHPPAVVFLHIFAGANPRFPNARQTLGHIAGESRIAPGSAAIIDPHGVVGGHAAVHALGGSHLDFAQGHANFGVEAAGQINPVGVRQGVAAFRFERFRGRDHNRGSQIQRSASKKEPPATGSMPVSLRQHYLEQVPRVCHAPARHSQPFAPPKWNWSAPRHQPRQLDASPASRQGDKKGRPQRSARLRRPPDQTYPSDRPDPADPIDRANDPRRLAVGRGWGGTSPALVGAQL